MTTNFERIKSMNIEELAEFFTDITGDACMYFEQNWSKERYLDCNKNIKQWLYTEAEEE